MNRLYFGANYYPEDWDESEIDSDVTKMRRLGFNIVRIGEFAWSMMEPSEGEFNFKWLHNVVDKMGEAGIKVILGTPTATPPHWLYKKHPEIAMILSDGKSAGHGCRRHCCSSNEIYRHYSGIIVDKLGKEFGSDQNVIGWQIDNEIYAWEPGCVCDACKSNFHKYLKEKYGSINEINRRWNLNIFSQHYDSIEDIPVPIRAAHNPHIRMEWNISQNKNHIDFVHFQADILHKYTNAPVGTDTMPFNGMDYRELNLSGKLDVAQFNHYNNESNEIEAVMWMDYMRKFSSRPFWNTETMPCWNGDTAACMPIPKEGFIYLNTTLPFILGGEAILFWLWRTHWAGHELMHGALLNSAGRNTFAVKEINNAIADIKKAEFFLTETKVLSDTAITFDTLSWNIASTQKMAEGLQNNAGEVCQFFRAAVSAGLHPDMIDLLEDLNSYKLVISPMTITTDRGNFRSRMKKWVENGGVWVVGPLSDNRDNCGAKYKNSPYGFIEELTGAYQVYEMPRPENGTPFEVINGDGETVQCFKSFELFDNRVGTPLLTVKKGHSSIVGLNCALKCNVGNGCVYILGTFPEEKELKRFISVVAKDSGVFVADADGALVTCRRGDKLSGEIITSMHDRPVIYRFTGQKYDIINLTIYEKQVEVPPFKSVFLKNI